VEFKFIYILIRKLLLRWRFCRSEIVSCVRETFYNRKQDIFIQIIANIVGLSYRINLCTW